MGTHWDRMHSWTVECFFLLRGWGKGDIFVFPPLAAWDFSFQKLFGHHFSPRLIMAGAEFWRHRTLHSHVGLAWFKLFVFHGLADEGFSSCLKEPIELCSAFGGCLTITQILDSNVDGTFSSNEEPYTQRFVQSSIMNHIRPAIYERKFYQFFVMGKQFQA